MRHALVTAGAKGLGLKVTEALLESGYSVSVTYRNDKGAAEQLKERWSRFEDRIQLLPLDVTNKQEIADRVDQAFQKFGRIDVLVNNAGPYFFERKKLLDYEESEWYDMLEGNLSAMFHMLKKVIPIMRKQQYGRIITYGFQGASNAPGWLYRSAYAAAKVGLVSLMKSIAVEEAENGITANMVCPGDITGEMKEATIAEARRVNDNKTPIGRSGTGEDIARTVLFLCDDNADMITGAVMEVTGAIDVIHRHR